MKPIYIYTTDPIDFWHGWLTEEQYLNQIRNLWATSRGFEGHIRSYNLFKLRASYGARIYGRWEGDGLETIYVAALPSGDYECPYMIAWKQGNNGTTFVASPYELPWLHTQWPDSKPLIFYGHGG